MCLSTYNYSTISWQMSYDIMKHSCIVKYCQARRFFLKTGGTGQRKNELGSHAFRADHVNVLAVGLYDFLYNGQSQSGAFFILAPGQISLLKTFPDFL